MGRIVRTSALAAVLATAALAAASIGPAAASARPNACKRFGHAAPGTVRTTRAERAVLCLVNRRRRAHGLPKLGHSDQLGKAAGRHDSYMVSHHCFSHQCSGEPSLDSRLRLVGYLVGGLRAWAYGENIAWGERSDATPAEIVRSWMHSPEHRANILNRSFRDGGVGVEWGTPLNQKARGGTYTIDFGYRLG